MGQLRQWGSLLARYVGSDRAEAGVAPVLEPRVLVVNEDPVTLRDLYRDTRALGWRVDPAQDGEHALTLAEAHEYAVVLMDLCTSERNGLQLVRALHVLCPRAAFVLVSTEAQVYLPNEPLFDETVAAILTQPWTTTELSEKLQRGLSRHERQAVNDTAPESGVRATPETVLLIEDNPGDAYLAESFLKEAGNYSVTRVARLSDALGCLQRQNYDFVLTDLSLPDARGLDAVASVQDAASDSTLLVLSGLMDEEVSVKAVRRGAQDFIVKDRMDAQRLGSGLRLAQERKRSQQRLERIAREDSLTGLFNRRMFLDRLDQLAARSRRTEQRFAVMFLDMDHFKQINDQQGHEIGDELLREVARRIALTVREYDTIARFGGDEFAILVEDLQDAQGAIDVASRLMAALAQPYQIGEFNLMATASLGIAVYPDAGESPEDLVACADTAMYAAKNSGRNRYCVYEPDESAVTPKESDGRNSAAAFREALALDQFVLHFQPQLDLKNGKLVGFEALLRLRRDGGLHAPASFIPELERSGAMAEVGEWVLNAACKKLSIWRQQQPALRMAVNVAAPQFDSGAIASTVAAALERFSLPPESLELEITEGLLMRDMQGARACLADLKRLGVRVSVDDFGTGYSSLACLSRFPVDALKIDRSFVAQATACKKSATVTSAIVGMGHRLGLSVIAEGVENTAQVEFLRSEGCDLAQGYLLGRPLADWPAGIAVGS